MWHQSPKLENEIKKWYRNPENPRASVDANANVILLGRDNTTPRPVHRISQEGKKMFFSRNELIIKDWKPHEETSYHKGELGGIRAGNNRML